MSAIENLINEKIELRQHDHQYILQSNPNIQFSSVTNIIDDHFKPFDKWRIARILTTNNSKYQHLTPEELVGQWNEVRDHGSRVHDEIEKFITSKTPPQYEESRHALKALDSIKKNVGGEWFPEVIVFSKKLKVAGSVDLIVKRNDSFSIYDWKTTKNIYKDNGGYGTSTQTKSMRDTNFNKYELQLSGYSYLLEQCHDIKIKNQYIVHLTKNDFEIISTENKRKLIRSIFGKIKNKTVSKKKKKSRCKSSKKLSK